MRVPDWCCLKPTRPAPTIETGVVRPDLVLRDLVKMLHPMLVFEPFEFLQPIDHP